MKWNNIFELIVTFLLLATACPSFARAEDIPRHELDALLATAGIPGPWHVDQGEYEEHGPHWQVDAFYAPRQIGRNICVSTLSIVYVGLTAGHYSIVGKEGPRRVVALQSCGDVYKLGDHFSELRGDPSDKQLAEAVRALQEFLRCKPNCREILSRYESDDLRSLLPFEYEPALHWISLEPDGNIDMSFIVKGVFPDLLVIQIAIRYPNKPEIYVTRENGPDIVPNSPPAANSPQR